jgi:hypothetical protein
MHLSLLLTTLLTPRAEQHPDDASSLAPQPDLNDVAEAALHKIKDLVEQFRQQPLSPTRTHCFEQQLQEQLRELGREVTQWTYNHLEPADVAALAKHGHFEAGPYTRLNRKTAQNAWTLFGQVRLWRVGYRPSDKSSDPTIFPLAMGLGLVQGASPALADRAARLLAGAGMTQQRVLQRLRQDYGVHWGVKKLRQVSEAVSQQLAAKRPAAQAEQLLAWLQQATASQGRHKPVLSVGRDGITLGVRCQGGSVYEVASTATVSVLDRRGQRRGTVYLAHVPEAGQPTLGRELTELLREVLGRWQGPLPRLCYVSDAGDNETGYYQRVLRRLKHPRTGKKLAWLRVVDYYHASERVWTLGELLFGKGRAAWSWARKMQRWLLKPGGVNRVLHSAAAYRDRYGLEGKELQEFRKAYAYLRKRMQHMRYAEYRRLGVPLGSGVTEAGCKTTYTQRLKLSGMRWQKTGAQIILNLRVLDLSGVWDQALQAALAGVTEVQVRGSQTHCFPGHVTVAFPADWR